MSTNFLENKWEVQDTPEFSEESSSKQAKYVNYEGSSQKEAMLDNSNSHSLSSGGNEDYSAVDYLNSEMQETVYKKVTRRVLITGAMLIPLFFLPWTTSFLELNKQILLAVVAGAGLVLWLLDVVLSGKLSWRFNPIDKGITALAGAVVLSTIFSVTRLKSLMGMAGSLSDSLLTVVALTAIYLLVVHSFDDRGKALRYFFSASLAVAIVYGLFQLLGLPLFKFIDMSILDSALSRRAFNTLGSVNVLGMIAAIVLPMLYTNKPDNRIIGYISKIGAVAALAVLIVVNWWVLWVVAIAGMVSVVALESLVSVGHENSFRMSRLLFPITVMMLGIFLIVVNLNLAFVKDNLPVEVVPSHRLSGKVAWKVLQENFAFGYGPENFSLAFDKYGAREIGNTSLSEMKFFDSTSYVLNTAVQNGLVGLASLGFVLWLLGLSLFKAIKSKLVSFDSENIGVISAVVAGIIATLFYPFNLSLIFTLYLLLALFVLAIWGSQKVVYNIEEKVSLSLVSSLGFIGGLILSLVGLYFISLNYIADFKYAKAIGHTQTQDALNDVVKAINWKGNDDRFYRLSSQLFITLLSNELSTPPATDDKNKRAQNYLSSAVVLAQKATQVAPNEVNNWSNLGNVYQNLLRLVDGSDSLAETAYLKASELRPGDPNFHNRIGNMYLVKAELLRQLAIVGKGVSVQQLTQQANEALLKAEDAYKKAIEMSSNFGLAIYNLGSVYDRQNKLSEAIKQLEVLVPFNNNRPGLAFELGLLYYRDNQKDKAFEQLQRAVVLFPDYANAKWYLALIYEERKQLNLAIEQLEDILKVETNKDNKTVIKKLGELKVGSVSIPPGKVLDQKPL